LKTEIAGLVLKNLKPITKTLIKSKIDGITSIPLHHHKERRRGFNQSHLIAKELARHFQVPYEKNLLERRINTKAQASLRKKERLRNMRAVFKVNPVFEIKNLRILIIDDVATTLSTLNEAAKALKRKRVKRVWGLTVAR
jgi:ComF family protein